MDSSLLFNLTTLGYFVSLLFFMLYLITRQNRVALCGVGLAVTGFLFNTLALGLRWYESYQLPGAAGRVPLTNLYESVVFFAWAIVLLYLLMDWRYRQRAVGAFVLPFPFLAMVGAQFLLSDTIEPLIPALQSNWLVYHVVACFLGYGAFTVACGVSVMYLIKKAKEEDPGSETPAGGLVHFFPSQRLLDEINYKAIMIGFPLLTLGIITGSIWASIAWGAYWSWDPKETWSLIVWLIYAAFLHARMTRGWVGRRAAWLSILGFMATLFCYLGVNLFSAGLHSYGSL